MNETPGQQIAALLATLGMLALLGWMEMPPWQREMIMRAARLRARQLLARAARASGHRAMGDELAGRGPEAEAGYAFTERLSRLRDQV